MDIAQIGGRDGGKNKVYLAFKNVDGGGSVTVNTPVCLAVNGNSVDGLNATHPAAVSLKSWIGIADSTVAINGFGRSQAYGYRDSILISNEGTSVTVTAGDALIPIAGTGIGLSSGGFNNGKYAVVGTTLTVSASGYTDGVIFAL